MAGPLFRNLNSVNPAGITSGASNLKSSPVTRTTCGFAAGARTIGFAAPDDVCAGKLPVPESVAAAADPTMRLTRVVTDAIELSSSVDSCLGCADRLCSSAPQVSTDLVD